MIEGISVNIAWYFFLAGTGSGAFMVHVLLGAAAPASAPRLLAAVPGTDVRAVPVACACLVLAGALFLLADLGVPALFFLVLCRLGHSVISFGALAIALFVALALGYALALGAHAPIVRTAVPALGWAAFAAALATACYTGYYLYSMGTVGLWATPLVVLLFFASSLSTGCAALGLLAFVEHPARRPLRLGALRPVELVLLAVEALLLGAFVASRLHAGGDAAALALQMVTGSHAVAFWAGAVGLGLALPAGAQLLAAKSGGEACALAAVFATLAGGFALRCCVLLA